MINSSGITLLWYLLLFCLPGAKAQVNYVLNPSFEKYDTCPNDFDQIHYAYYWNAIDSNWTYFYPSDGQPELINTCDNSGYYYSSCPVNYFFYAYPRTGNGMTQILMFAEVINDSFPYYYQRDYLQGRLYKPLIPGKTYCVTFYMRQEHSSYYSLKNVGAYFDDGQIDTTVMPGMPQTEYIPQVVENFYVNDTTHWMKVEGSFTASNNERFITIGNFKDNAHTDTASLFMDTSLSFKQVLNLIDDVSVVESDHIAFAGNDTTIAKGDSTFLGEIAVPYTWYKDGSAGLTMIDSTSGGIWVKPDTNTTYVVKQTLCGVVTWDTVVVTVVPVNVTSPGLSKGEVTVWPNPVTSVLHVEANEDVHVSISSIDGKVLLRDCFVPRNDGSGVNVEALPSGVYFLEITNSDGERVIRKIVK